MENGKRRIGFPASIAPSGPLIVHRQELKLQALKSGRRVIKDQHHFPRENRQAIDNTGQHDFKWWWLRRLEQRYLPSTKTRMHSVKRSERIGPKARGVIITAIQRNPGG